MAAIGQKCRQVAGIVHIGDGRGKADCIETEAVSLGTNGILGVARGPAVQATFTDAFAGASFWPMVPNRASRSSSNGKSASFAILR